MMASADPPPGSSPADVSGLVQAQRLLDDGLQFVDVVHDSRQVSAGSVYVCLRGERFDGHDFAADAVRSGATALVTDHLVETDRDIPQIIVDDTRRRVGPLASFLLGEPSAQLATVGITGTNGKTTTAQILETILIALGWPTGVVGTLHGPRTTPEAPDLQRMLQGFVADGARAAVLEVSSHALELHRVDGTRFDVVIFTNLGHDHLDLHGSQEDYFRAKARLFDPGFAPLGLINVDDPYGRLLADAVESDEQGHRFRVVPLSLSQVEDIEVTAAMHRYRWRGHLVEVPIGGRFNVANSLAAVTAAVELGFEPGDVVEALGNLAPVPGRFEVVPAASADQPTVVVDYAHTPDGLAEVLSSARAICEGGSVIVVFGCGGERDRPKRPEMGAIAARLADHVVITSDNPRGESPDSIIDDVIDGVPADYRARVVTNTDRRAAIDQAIRSAAPADIVVIAGKGHEATQEFADRVVDFDDRKVAAEILEARA